MEKKLQEILEDPSIFHFKRYWLEAPLGSLEERLLAVFSFGTICDVSLVPFELGPLMIEKLRKLTIISLAMENRNLTYSTLLRQCGMDDISLLEEYLVTLQPIVKTKMDQVEQNIIIVECLDGRDVYCNEKPLPTLKEMPCTREYLISGLQQWKLKLQNDILE